MSAWGILGNPTKEQIETWKDLPHGAFSSMVSTLKKKSKGKSLKRYTVKIKNVSSKHSVAFVDVQAFDVDQAISQARDTDQTTLEWSEMAENPNKYEYSVIQCW